MTIGHDRWRAHEAAGKLPDLQKRMEAVNAELRTAMVAARNYSDPENPTATTGLVEERQRQMRELAQQKATKQRESLEAERRELAGQIRGWADRLRPRVKDDPLQLQRMSLGWDRAKALLAAKHSMTSVIEGATDPAMLLAIREWGPDWVRANNPPQSGLSGQRLEVDTSGLARSVDKRLGAVLGGEVEVAVGLLQDAEAFDATWSAMDLTYRSAMNGVRQRPADTLVDAYATSSETSAAAQVHAGYQEPTKVVPGEPSTHGEAAA